MSNRRRHFPFGGISKSPSHASSSTSHPSTYEMGKSRFHLSLGDSPPFKDDTKNLISSIHQCLTSCASYTQALNNLCGTGTHFAKCLVNLFQNLHPYQEIAGQFLDIWKSLSDATGTASAAVKTETLMNLQDILIRLESNEDNKIEGNVSPLNSAENVQILFTCLNSFLRLQALFSCSSWESLDKLSRNIDDPQNCSTAPSSHSNDSTYNSSRLDENISGHFKPLLSRMKPYESSSANSPNTFNVKCSATNDGNAYQSSTISNISPSQVWNNVTIPSSNDQSGSETPISCASSPKKSFQDTSKSFVSAEELQDVLDLLSCHPDSYDHTSSCPSLLDEKVKCLSSHVHDYKRTGVLSNSPRPSVIGLERETFYQDFGKSTWPRTNGNINPSTWSWMFSQCDNENPFQFEGSNLNYTNGEMLTIGGPLNRKYTSSIPPLDNPPHHKKIDGSPFNFHNKQPSDLSVTSDGQTKSRSSTQGDSSSSSEEANDTENVFSIGLNIEISDLVESVRQRRHSSSDGLPDNETIEMIAPFAGNNNVTLDSRIAKTSTWPLKQQSLRMNNQPSLFFGHEASDSATITSTELPIWNNSSILNTSSSFSSSVGHSDIEKYSLFGRN